MAMTITNSMSVNPRFANLLLVMQHILGMQRPFRLRGQL